MEIKRYNSLLKLLGSSLILITVLMAMNMMAAQKEQDTIAIKQEIQRIKQQTDSIKACQIRLIKELKNRQPK